MGLLSELVDFSLFYFADDARAASDGRYELLLAGARLADEAGLAAVWTPERHFHPFGGLYPSPAVSAAAVAAVTRRIGVRAGSVVLPLNDPVRVAEEWSMIDNLSGGRAGIAFASGWHAIDFTLHHSPVDAYTRRREILRDGVDTVRRLWRGETLIRTDGGGEPAEIRIYPSPVQPHLPFWITSSGSPETFSAAGTAGGGVLTHLLGQDIDTLAEKVDIYRRAYAAAQRRPSRGWDGKSARPDC
jgi:natural product biosynthesis luciferase-like monooxygenase protein